MFKKLCVVVVLAMLAMPAFAGSAAAVSRVSLSFASGASTDVLETHAKAVPTYAHPSWPTLTGAVPIWVDAGPVTTNPGPYTFQTTVAVPAAAANVRGAVRVTADNAYQLWVNGQMVGANGIWSTLPSSCLTVGTEWQTVGTWDVSTYLRAGTANLVEVKALNYTGTSQPVGCIVPMPNWAAVNPAMALFTIDASYDPVMTVGVVVTGSIETNTATVHATVVSSLTFNATTVDPKTVCLGSATNKTLRNCAATGWSFEDVNGDGLMDLGLWFAVAGTGLTPADTQAYLTGSTFDASFVEGYATLTHSRDQLGQYQGQFGQATWTARDQRNANDDHRNANDGRHDTR